MASTRAGLPDELAGHQAGQGASGLVLPDGPRYPRIVQAWLWLKKPTWFLDRCSAAYGDVFTVRLPLGLNMVHIARPELVKAVYMEGIAEAGVRMNLRCPTLGSGKIGETWADTH